MKNTLSKEGARAFLNSLGSQQLLQVFDLLDNTLFWIKDSEGRFIHTNRYGPRTLVGSHRSQEEFIGLTDFDLFPRHMAAQFVEDDRQVMRGNAIVERLEMNILPSGEIGWVSTSKHPLFSPRGEVVGTYGISHFISQSPMARKALDELEAPINYIRENYMHQISIAELADKVNVSVSALERRFAKHMHQSPKQFINEIRLEKARHLLRTASLPISSVAYQTGFSDPGYFTRQYHKRFGLTPSQELSDSQSDHHSS